MSRSGFLTKAEVLADERGRGFDITPLLAKITAHGNAWTGTGQIDAIGRGVRDEMLRASRQ